MDYKQIQELIKLINKSNIGELNIEEKDFKITIRQKEDPQIHSQAVASPVYYQPSLPGSMATQPSFQQKETAIIVSDETITSKNDNLITVKSPMIGTFYKRPSPDKPAFVETGDDIIPGKVLCVIEAMKLFNEIESEVSGRIVKILVDDSSPVEYDQPLFLVDPS